jgi:hypothetical protein
VTVRMLDEVCALHALTRAAHHGRRGAEAVSAVGAREAGRPLVPLDPAPLTRLVNRRPVCPPAVARAALPPPSQPPASCLSATWGLRGKATSTQGEVLALGSLQPPVLLDNTEA